MSKEEVKAWRLDPVTQEFFSYLNLIITDCDNQVHTALSNNEPTDAMLHNAAMSVIRDDVLDIPERLMEEAQDET